MQRKAVYPFCGIVGQEDMKLALILNVINPSLGGVLIKGEKGTAKSTAVRALADLLPEMHSVAGCKFNCNPKDIKKICADCSKIIDSNEYKIKTKKSQNFVFINQIYQSLNKPHYCLTPSVLLFVSRTLNVCSMIIRSVLTLTSCI